MNNAHDDDHVPTHEVRESEAEDEGFEFVAYHSLIEATTDPDATVVLTGDSGSTIFLTVRVRHLGCDVRTLWILVSDLDAVTWMGGDREVASVALERYSLGTRVSGGYGGGQVVDGVWTHPDFLPSDISEQAVEVALGKRARIDLDLLRRTRETEIASIKRWREAYRAKHPDSEPLPWDFDIHPPTVPFE
jgi:hypothetical protein